MERPFSESDWLATPEPVRRHVESLEQRVAQLEETVAQMAKRIEQLESRLNQNSQNSSKPPSSDPPYQRPERGSKKSKRRRGGQKGHKGHRVWSSTHKAGLMTTLRGGSPENSPPTIRTASSACASGKRWLISSENG